MPKEEREEGRKGKGGGKEGNEMQNQLKLVLSVLLWVVECCHPDILGPVDKGRFGTRDSWFSF